MLPPFGSERLDEIVGRLRGAAAGFVDVASIGQGAVDLGLNDVQRDLDEIRTVRRMIGDAKRLVRDLDVPWVRGSSGCQKLFARDGLADGKISRIDVRADHRL